MRINFGELVIGDIAKGYLQRVLDKNRISMKIGELRVDQINKSQSLIKELLGMRDWMRRWNYEI